MNQPYITPQGCKVTVKQKIVRTEVVATEIILEVPKDETPAKSLQDLQETIRLRLAG